jgi:F-type H+-transporting ATPase subunit gamma
VTERLADIGDRITGIRQLGAVVNAMRGIAAARAQQARGQLVAVDRYTATIAAAIAQALPLIPPGTQAPIERRGKPRLGLLLFCAEQGFAGAFSERVLDAAGPALRTAQLFVIGTRGHAVLAERGIKAVWTGALPSHSPGIPRLADQVAQALYAQIAAEKIDHLDAIYSRWQPGQGTRIERTHLLPFDMAAFAAPNSGSVQANANPPMLYLPPEAVVQALTADYMLAELCRAGVHAFAAENEARMEAMAAARGQIERQLGTLQATQRRVRQEEITAEIIELASGEAASRARVAG